MIISNTRVTTRNLCKRMDYYRFILNIEPRVFPHYIDTGLLGHSALEIYYSFMRDGSPVDECKKAALNFLREQAKLSIKEAPEDFERIQRINYLVWLIDGYAEFYRVEPFKVLEVEKVYTASITTDINYGMKLDTLVEFTSGKYRGDLVVMDHKFVYNFKSIVEIQMDAQLPKYIKTLQDNGYTVTKGLFNQLRRREMKNPQPEDLFRRSWLKTNKAESEQIWREQTNTAIKIYSDSRISIDTIKDDAVRTLSLIVCRSCMFADLCKAELNGDNVTNLLTSNYKQSTYGYTEFEGD